MNTDKEYRAYQRSEFCYWARRKLIALAFAVFVSAAVALCVYQFVHDSITTAEKDTAVKIEREIGLYGYNIADPTVLPNIAKACRKNDASTLKVVGKSPASTAKELYLTCILANDNVSFTMQITPLP